MPTIVNGWMSPMGNTVRVELGRNGGSGGPELGRASALCCRSQPQARAATGWVTAEPLTASKTLAMGSISLNLSFLT